MNSNTDLATKIETWLAKNSNYVFYALLAIFVLSSLLHFSLRLSIAGDDSTYITRALNFIESGKYPDYQAPLYPIFLAAIIAIIGINIPILKLSSLLLLLIFMVLFYRTFKNKVNFTILTYSFTILSLSSYFIFFSSQTFSEPLFLVFTILFFHHSFRWIPNKAPTQWTPQGKDIKEVLLISLFALGMYLTRTVGIGAIISLIVFLLINKDYKRASWSIITFGLFVFVFNIIRDAIWDIPSSDSVQALQLLSKNPYNAAEGNEDILGFINRLIDNSNLYLSKHFLRIIGFRTELNNTVLPFATIGLYALYIWGLFTTFKQNKYLLFTAIFITTMLGITFISLQKLWDQYRLIIPFIPFMLLFICNALINLFKTNRIKKYSKIVLLIFAGSIILTGWSSVKKTDLDNLSQNINGNIYAGFTPDWVSYLKMVNYVNTQLPNDSYVACRKPNIARIYANGKKFYGIYRIPSDDPYELAKLLKDKGITHVIMGSLRKNPYAYTGKSINTIQRFLSPMGKLYPEAFSIIKKYGEQEPTYLIKINYDIILNKAVQ
ncbi:hypothetical protein [Saccharicrinis aurantiacus]|uniref:hypothetical protein n=1 Tax=Saccharicrinis aurantiacus TaxID=1849719 RepID=UPI0008391F89|nr:hypothetical protein [Saccharicrinis aurantiacus]